MENTQCSDCDHCVVRQDDSRVPEETDTYRQAIVTTSRACCHGVTIECDVAICSVEHGDSFLASIVDPRSRNVTRLVSWQEYRQGDSEQALVDDTIRDIEQVHGVLLTEGI